MPLNPYVITGTVRKGPNQGFSRVSGTVDGGGGQTVNLSVSDGVQTANSQAVTLKHTSSGETLSATTNSSGQYSVDLADLTTYAVNDAFTVSVDTRSGNDASFQITRNGVDIRSRVLSDVQGKVHDENYPLPVVLGSKLVGHPQVTANVRTDWTITRGDGQPDDETITLPDGSQYNRTFSYNTNGIMTMRSRWEVV